MLTSFSVDARSLLAHRFVGALALLPEPLGALRIVGADARPVCDGAPDLPAVAERPVDLPGRSIVRRCRLKVADHGIEARDHFLADREVRSLDLGQRCRSEEHTSELQSLMSI